MIKVANIGVSKAIINGKERVSLDFSQLSSLSKGDTLVISAFDDYVETETIGVSSTELWLDWIISIYNIVAENGTASRDGKVLEILSNDSRGSNLSIDTGNVE